MFYMERFPFLLSIPTFYTLLNAETGGSLQIYEEDVMTWENRHCETDHILNFCTVFLTEMKLGKSRKGHCSSPLVG